MSYAEPDIVGVWLLKWVIGPLLAIGLIAWLINLEVMKHKCRKMAEERGYIEVTYIPPNRAGFGEQCICRKKQNPDGTIDDKAKLVIDLD
jgi:hypothetical protein